MHIFIDSCLFASLSVYFFLYNKEKQQQKKTPHWFHIHQFLFLSISSSEFFSLQFNLFTVWNFIKNHYVSFFLFFFFLVKIEGQSPESVRREREKKVIFCKPCSTLVFIAHYTKLSILLKYIDYSKISCNYIFLIIYVWWRL